MRRTTLVVVAVFLLVALCPSLKAQSSQPTFLFLLEGRGVPSGTIHVFSLNSLTGALTELPGSPFNAGLVPQQLVVDPTGRFVYVTNSQSHDITALSVDPASGTLTEMPGSPFLIGATPVTSAIDPTGRFLYVFADNGGEFLYQYTIDSATGVLTAAISSPTLWEGQTTGVSINSIAFNPAGDHAYLGQLTEGNGGAPILVCKVDFNTGTLSRVQSVQPAITGEAAQLAVTSNGSFLYSVNSVFSQADAFSIRSSGASLTEISGSPYSVPYGPASLVVHPSGNFVYTANSNNTFQAPPSTGPIAGSIYAFSINSGTGGLTPISGSPYSTVVDPLSIVIDPTGSFAYWTSTSTTLGKPFAQISGYAINPLTGVLSPLSGLPWTDPVTSNGGQLVISSGPASAPNPVPMISSLSPSSTVATDTAFTLQVIGTNFVPGAVVYFAGQPRATTFVSPTQLNAAILGSDIDNDGTAVVFVFNPLPGGGDSTSVEFPISTPAPILTSLSPATVNAGGPNLTIDVFGSNFVTSSVISFNGAALTTSYGNPNVIAGFVPAADIVAAGSATISVTTPSNGVAGGGISNTLMLSIVPPPPPFSVSSMSPTVKTAGDPGFTLTVNGSGFVPASQAPPGSQISFNLLNMSTTFVSSTQLTAFIPTSSISIAGRPYVFVTNPNGFNSTTLPFTVNNPQPGGGAITPPSSPAGNGDLVLDVSGVGFVQGPPGSTVFVNGSSQTPVFKTSTLLQATLSAKDLAHGGTLSITVVNPPPGGGSTAALSFNVTDYSLMPLASPPPVTAGKTASFALTLAPSNGEFPNPVTFSISPATPLPRGADATFTPSNSVTPGGAPQIVTLSIATTPHTTFSAFKVPRGLFPILPWALLTGMGIVLAWSWFLAPFVKIRRLAPQLFLGILIAAVTVLTACVAAGGGSSSTPLVNPATGTPAGTYHITVNATSGGVSHSTNITLKVM